MATGQVNETWNSHIISEERKKELGSVALGHCLQDLLTFWKFYNYVELAYIIDLIK